MLQYEIIKGKPRVCLDKHTRVDPDLFPENEFPVECTECGYPLRGLSSDRCPECGATFDRGRLIVERYVLGKRPRTSRVRKLLRASGVIGLIVGAAFVGFVLTVMFAARRGYHDLLVAIVEHVRPWHLAAVGWVWFLSTVTAAVTSLYLPYAHWRKRRRVMDVLRAAQADLDAEDDTPEG